MANLQKQAKFNQKMGRQKFSKGGYIKKLGNRQYFDSGGFTSTSDSPAVTGASLGVSQEGGAVANALTPSQGTPGQQNPYVQSNATNPNTGVLGTIGGALGLNNNFQASSANITPGTNAQQLATAYTGVQNALANQQGLVSTLTPQAQAAVNQQNQIAAQEAAMAQGAGPNPAQNQLAQATGTNVANQAALMAGQRGASGNVGLAARNIGQQGAATQQTAAGQAATLGAQQQIAAQNNLANLSNQQLSQTGQAITGLSSAQQNEQATLQNANTSFNNAAVGMQSNINNVNSQTAAANQNMAGNILGGIGSAASSFSSLFAKGGVVGDHLKLAEMNAHSLGHSRKYFDEGGEASTDLGTFKANEASASSPDVASTSTLPADQTNLSSSFGGKSGGGGGGGGLGALAALAEGGQIQANPLVEGIVHSPNQAWSPGTYNSAAVSGGPTIGGTASLPTDTNSFSKDVKNMQNKPKKAPANSNAIPGGSLYAGSDSSALQQNPIDPNLNSDQTKYASKGGGIWSLHPSKHAEYSANHFAHYFSKGGTSKEVKAMVSPGERYWNPSEVDQIKHGADPMKLGTIFPGKDKVPGKDSLKNDTVPTTLEEGGIVNPLHVEKTKDPDKARLFVLKSLRATGKHMKKPEGMK